MVNAYQPTFSTFLTEVQDICENSNSEFVANIPLFMQRAQDQLQRDLAMDFWRTIITTPITTQNYTRSPDWLIIRSIYIPSLTTWVLRRHRDYVRMWVSSTGPPKYFAEDTDSSLLIGPTPDQSYTPEVEVYTRLPALVLTSNESNWLTKNAGDLYLIQILINAHEYLVAPERKQGMMELYGQMLPGVLQELRVGERRRYEPMRAAPRPTLQPGGTG